MKKAKGSFFGIILFGILFFFSACTGGETDQPGMAYNIYYVNQDETKIVEREYRSETTDSASLFEEIVGQLAAASERMEYESPLQEEFALLGHT
ncbi:MAG: hypothetical protein K2N37_03695, partial [Lachnospiraceae bacterium]|nr:hypothetical protein [Lachnospiraceae bacterium]